MGRDRAMIQTMKPRMAMIPTDLYCFKANARGWSVSDAESVPMMMEMHVMLPEREARLNAAMSTGAWLRPT